MKSILFVLLLSLNVGAISVDSDKKAVKVQKSVYVESEVILEWATKDYLIKIVKLKDGTYKYFSWSTKSSFQNKPDLVIVGGEMTYDGSAGNHYYTFKNNEYEYRCSVTILGKSATSYGYIEIFKNGKEILFQTIMKEYKRNFKRYSDFN